MLADTQGEFTKVRFYFSLVKPLKKVLLDSVFEGSFFFLFYSLLRCKVQEQAQGQRSYGRIRKSWWTINSKYEKGRGGCDRLPPLWPGFYSQTWCHMWVECGVGSRPLLKGFFSEFLSFPSVAIWKKFIKYKHLLFSHRKSVSLWWENKRYLYFMYVFKLYLYKYEVRVMNGMRQILTFHILKCLPCLKKL